MTKETTWMGTIPESWKSIPLKYVFDIQKRIAGEEGYTVLSITQSGIKPKNMDAQGQYAQDYSNYQLVYPGDFAMNHMDLLTGWVDISKHEGVTSPDYRVFVNRDADQFCSEYYKYIFQYCYSNKVFYGMGQGVSGFGRWRLPADMFLNFRLPVPSLEEQKRIASFLEQKICDMDAIIAEAKASIEEYKAWKASIIYEAVTKGLDPNVEMKDSGVQWIGSIPKCWKCAKARQVSEFINGYAFQSDDFSQDGIYPVIRIGDIQNGGVDFSTCQHVVSNDGLSGVQVQKNDILLAMSGATVGKVGYVYDTPLTQAYINQRVGIYRTKDTPKYFYYLFSQPSYIEYALLTASGTAQPNISTESAKNFFVPIPPVSEREEICEYLDKKCFYIDGIIAEKQSLVADLEIYKKALIFEVVTGKQRVIE